MATSGYFITSDSGQGGGNYYGRLVFEWWRDSWGRSGASGYHNISYTLKTYGGNTTYWQYCYNNSMNVDGQGYSAGQTKAYGGGATTILSGSKTLWTDSNGNRSFGASAQAGIYNAAVNTSGSGSWAMDNIPMHSAITNASGNQNDEFANPWVDFTNPAGTAVDVFIEIPTLSGAIAPRANVGSRYTWTLTTPELDAIRTAMANVNSATIRFVVHDSLGGVGSWTWIDRTITIVNGNPTFTNFTYKDTNASTVAITGNDQYLIQGYSTLQAKVTVANKATANKSATMVKYLYSVAGLSSEKTWSNVADVDNDIGVLSVGTNQTLAVTARDSRTNQTVVNKTVNIVPYTAPVVNATTVRVNNFEATTNIHIDGSVSMLDVAGTKKNTVNSTSGVQYRYREAGGTWGSWTNRASSLNTTTGAVTTTDFTLSLDNTKQYEFEFKIIDVLTTTTVATTVSRGIAIMRVSTSDDLIYNKEQPLMPSHVGMIIQTTALTTAGAVSAIYGGTWVAWGTGRVPVGVDTGQTEFNTVGKTGGHKLLQSHTHAQNNWLFNGAGASGSHYGYGYLTNTGAVVTTNTTGSNSGGEVGGNFNSLAGGGNAENLQPYITCYMWKRTV